MNERIRIGVLGAGHLGRIHVQQLLEVPAFELVGFHDPHPEKCEALHKEFGATVFPNAEDLLAQVDVVDIVTPTLSHFKLAKAALERGSHVFIEKPVTNTVEEARELVALATKVERVVQVGHVERFNPAFQAALPYFKDPMFIESHRLAQFNPRGTDVSVVLDLMIHDIDIVQSVVQSPVAQVSASGVAVVSDTPDIANARIRERLRGESHGQQDQFEEHAQVPLLPKGRLYLGGYAHQGNGGGQDADGSWRTGSVRGDHRPR